MARANSRQVIAGVQVIGTGLTLYVDPTGNDTTGDGTVGNPWATPHKAYDYLRDFRVKENAAVTISCAAGTYAFSTQLNLSHNDGDRITLQGAALTGATPVNTDFAAGAAANEAFIRGRYATVFEFNGLAAGLARISVIGSKAARISNIAVIQTGADSGALLSVTDASNIRVLGPCAFHGGTGTNIQIDNVSSLLARSHVSSTNSSSNGVISTGASQVRLEEESVFVGNAGNGVVAANHSYFRGHDTCSKDNYRGFVAQYNSTLIATGSRVGTGNNTSDDFEAFDDSYMSISVDKIVAGIDIVATGKSVINTSNVAGVSYSPAFGVAGNNDSLIY